MLFHSYWIDYCYFLITQVWPQKWNLSKHGFKKFLNIRNCFFILIEYISAISSSPKCDLKNGICLNMCLKNSWISDFRRPVDILICQNKTNELIPTGKDYSYNKITSTQNVSLRLKILVGDWVTFSWNFRSYFFLN